MTEDVRPTRRLFFGAAGAAVAAPLAVAAPALASAAAGENVAARLARLEDESAVRALRDAYVRALARGRADEAAALFADPAKAAVDGSIRELAADPLGAPEAIEVAAGGASAAACAPYTVRTERPVEASFPHLEMAREMGEGVIRRTERRVLELACVKHDGTWRIESAGWRAA